MAVNAEAIARAVAPVVAEAGLDLEDVVVHPAGRRTLVRVVVDVDGGLSLDAVAAVSGPVSDAIDASGLVGETGYTLEVTSPGVDRPLTEPRHWRRARGRLVEVALATGDTFTARLTGSDDEAAEFAEVGRTVALADVSRAQVQVEFNARPSAGPVVDAEDASDAYDADGAEGPDGPGDDDEEG